MKRALLLNADYSPLHFISDIDAFILVYKGVAEMISIWEGSELTSPGRTWACPATVRLIKRVARKWKFPRFRKKVLVNRDEMKCQYCNVNLCYDSVTIDHVKPKSRGGSTSWRNCVVSCKPCNKKKADKTPVEAGMNLKKIPIEPSAINFLHASKGNFWHDDWGMFLPKN